MCSRSASIIIAGYHCESESAIRKLAAISSAQQKYLATTLFAAPVQCALKIFFCFLSLSISEVHVHFLTNGLA